MKKITHAEFILRCAAVGIHVSKITKTMVHLSEDKGKWTGLSKANPITVSTPKTLSNIRKDLLDKPIFDNIRVRNGEFLLDLSLKDLLIKGARITSIKLIHAFFNLSLADSVHVVNENWENWKHEVGV